MKRIRRLIEKMNRAIRRGLKEREAQRAARREAAHARRVRHRNREDVLKEIDRERERQNPDEEKIRKLKHRAAELSDRAEDFRKEAHHHDDRIENITSRIAWAVKRRTVLRKKLERKRRERKPSYESWMANGHEGYNLTNRAKELLAIAVSKYGLYCTSITRDWGTGSYHEQIPTRGFDCGGPRMTEYQRDLRAGRIEGFDLDDLLELFGPDNAACAINGNAYWMSEGSANEQLHDNHVHSFVYGA